MSFPKTAVLISCYKRPEYTELCLKSIYETEDYRNVTFYLVDEGCNFDILKKYARPQDIISKHDYPHGLRNTIIEFIEWARKENIEIISKVDNDCIVPKDWLTDLINILVDCKVDILSPNVSETQAAFKYGKDDTYGFGFRPSNFVGGLWTMWTRLTDGIFLERTDTHGIIGAFPLLHQIIKLQEEKPIIGWTDKVTFEDVGHWGGSHRNHIKSEGHMAYSNEVGRPISWTVEAGA